MFEAVELGRKISKDDFDKQLPGLRAKLLEAHFKLRQSNTPVIIIISGADGAGKGDVVYRLNEWLDPRGIDTHAFWQSSDEETERPPFWRYWRVLPARGRIGILFGSWYTKPLTGRVYGKIKNPEMDAMLDRISFFENMLVEDGALILKIWLHLSKKAQRKRLEDLAGDPRHHWRVLPTDWKHYKLYDKFISASERLIQHTGTGKAPWQLVEATDARYRDLTVATLLLKALEKKLGRAAKATTKARVGVKHPAPTEKADTILDHVDLTQRLSGEAYDLALEKYQGRLGQLMWAANEKKISNVLVFEGWDAAGKGSAIRRLTEAIDPRLFRILAVAAPTQEERAQHYLWRFWRAVPRAGRVAIYDRSWYGRVLVERVEGYATEPEWMRAYSEINEFEEQLSDSNIVISKFWIHISKEEQLRRFRKREEVPYKQHKITPDDWRNRKKWDAYKAAVNDMVARTSTGCAPWTLVAGNDKKFARIQILKAVCRRLEEVL